MRSSERRLPAMIPFSPGTNGDTSNPARLAVITPLSVDAIGNAAAGGIEQVIDQLGKEQADLVGKLRELAAAIRGHTQIANERIAAFCTMQAEVLEKVKGLETRIGGRPEAADDGAALPTFLKKGPANGEGDPHDEAVH